jgi:5-methylcytosine-specific restriction endonuclease McrA
MNAIAQVPRSQREYLREWRLKNLARERAKDRARYAANPERKRQQARAWVIANPEKARRNNQAWKAVHHEQELARKRAYDAANREHVRALKRACYAANLEENRRQKREWAKAHPEPGRRWDREHPEKKRATYNTRRARIKGIGGKHSAEDMKAQYERQSGKCFWCKAKLGKYHVDHVIPIAKGGSNDPSNIVISCPLCNTKKGAKMPAEFAGRLL